VDVSWVVIAVLVTWAFFADLWTFDRDASVVAAALVAVAGSLAFFGSVLVHELSHSLVALRRNIPVQRIRLFVFGGVSEIEQDATTPGDEFTMTIAGPLASFALGGVFYLLALALPYGGLIDRMTATLAVINVALGVFNLLPGFPLDGGRVLRSIVWRVTGDFDRATRVAVWGGRIVALALAGAGVYVLVATRNPFGLWYLFIGWFLFSAAGNTLVRMEALGRMQGLTAADLMAPAIRMVDGTRSLAAIADEFDPQRGDPPLPVLSGGRVRGLVGYRQLAETPAEAWGGRRVEEVMDVIGPDDVVEAMMPLEQTVSRLLAARGRVVVVSGGRMVGTLTATDVERWLKVSPS